MNIQELFSTIFGVAVLSALVLVANAQVTEQGAREEASNIVRSELHSALDFNPERWIGVWRDEELEQSLATIVGGRSGLRFIYKASPEGVEIRENAIVYHAWNDVDFMFIVVVNPTDQRAFRIHGFGLVQSLEEFEKLMISLRVKVSNTDQAESVTEFYREVNPENQKNFTAIPNLLELKQAAERQCQSGAKSFDAGEKAFAAWWKHAERRYAALPFQQRAVPHGSDYLVEWIVLSSPSGDNCGGAPLRAQLEIGSDGRVGKLTFSPGASYFPDFGKGGNHR